MASVVTSVIFECLDFFVLRRHARDLWCWVGVVTLSIRKSPNTFRIPHKEDLILGINYNFSGKRRLIRGNYYKIEILQ